MKAKTHTRHHTPTHRAKVDLLASGPPPGRALAAAALLLLLLLCSGAAEAAAGRGPTVAAASAGSGRVTTPHGRQERVHVHDRPVRCVGCCAVVRCCPVAAASHEPVGVGGVGGGGRLCRTRLVHRTGAAQAIEHLRLHIPVARSTARYREHGIMATPTRPSPTRRPCNAHLSEAHLRLHRVHVWRERALVHARRHRPSSTRRRLAAVTGPDLAAGGGTGDGDMRSARPVPTPSHTRHSDATHTPSTHTHGCATAAAAAARAAYRRRLVRLVDLRSERALCLQLLLLLQRQRALRLRLEAAGHWPAAVGGAATQATSSRQALGRDAALLLELLRVVVQALRDGHRCHAP